MKRVVLDTNVLLVSISDKSKLHWVFKNLIDNKYQLYVTTDILLEYSEILSFHINQQVSESVLGVFENLSNVNFITNYYRFNLLKDEDDNKFVDCAIAANADFIVTHDNDFKTLNEISFPKVKIISSAEFKGILLD